MFIFNYNGCDVILQMLELVCCMDYLNVQVFVIDNGCIDDFVVVIEGCFFEVCYFYVYLNKGIFWGFNYGIQYVFEVEYDYLFFCNNDIEVVFDMLMYLVEVVESDMMIGCVGFKLYYYLDWECFWLIGGWLCFCELIIKE